MALKSADVARPHQLMDGGSEMDARRQRALPTSNGVGWGNLVRDAAKAWKVEERKYFKGRHCDRAEKLGCRDVVEAMYEKQGTELEDALRPLMALTGVGCVKLDDGKHPGWPDSKLEFADLPSIITEVKSKQSETSLVPLNDATEVLAASDLAGLGGNPCLTVCSPGVEPSVATSISSCTRLCVVEVVDLVEAVLRHKEGNLPVADIYNWLTTPGLALREDLPFINI